MVPYPKCTDEWYAGPPGESIYGFGSGKRGQIGFSEGKSRSNNLPKVVDGFVNCEIVYICANGDHSAALSANGQLYTWGRGFSGSTDDYFPRTCPSSLRFSQVALGWNHALVIGDDHVYMLGGRHHGMLSGSQQANLEQHTSVLTAACSRSDVIDESSQSKLLPESSFSSTLQRVPGLEEEKIACIAAGAEHSAIVTEKGMIMTWGWGEHGQLGLDNTDDQTCPRTVNLMSASCVPIRVYCGSGFTFVSST